MEQPKQEIQLCHCCFHELPTDYFLEWEAGRCKLCLSVDKWISNHSDLEFGGWRENQRPRRLDTKRADGAKSCADCGEMKDLDEYPKNSRTKDGRSTYCKPCAAIRRTATRLKDPAREKHWKNVSASRRKENRKSPEFYHPRGEKICKKCTSVQPLSNFGKQNTLDGLHTWCKACVAAYASSRYHSDAEFKASEQLRSLMRDRERKKRVVAWRDDEAIARVYSERDRLTLETGIMHHVDHIIPLQGELVSGLHVEGNLQILPAEDNLSKKNRFDPWTFSFDEE